MTRATRRRPASPPRRLLHSVSLAIGDTIRRGRLESGPILRAEVTLQPDTLDETARTVEAVIATENAVTDLDRRSWRPIRGVLRMDGMVATERVPLTDVHSTYTCRDVFGSVHSLRRAGKKMLGTAQFASDTAADEIFTRVREGHLRSFSIRARVMRSVDITPGKTKTVKGQQYTAPDDMAMRVVTRWQPIEVALCVIGADPDAVSRAAAAGPPPPLVRPPSRKDPTMKTFHEYLIERGFDPDALTDEQAATLRRAYDAEMAAPTPPAPTPPGGDVARDGVLNFDELKALHLTAAEAAQAEVRSAEVARSAAIRELGGDDVDDAVITRCIAEGLTVADASKEVLRSVRESRPNIGAAPAIVTGGVEVSRELIEAGLVIGAGKLDDTEIVQRYGEQTANQADRFRGLNVMDLCRHAIRMDGRDVPHDTGEMIERAMSGMTLSVITAATANKHVAKGYGAPRKTWQKWCSVASMSNFQTQSFLRFTTTGELEEVSRTGEVSIDTGEEESETGRIRTYGKLFWLSRQDVYDDNKRVFSKIPYDYGVQGANRVSKLVYTALLANAAMADSVAFFHATHANLNTSAALTPANLSAAIAAFLAQTNAKGDPVDLDPAILLVPPELSEAANSLYEGRTILITGSTDAKRMARFADAGRLVPVVESRLSNANYTGYSATTWFIAASPSVADNFAVGFLNGKQDPTVQRVEPAANRLAVGYRVYIDAGVIPIDDRTMQKNTA